jgi:hypothetical protein
VSSLKLAAWLLMLSLAGCGGGGAKGVPKNYVPVSGVVTFNDEPLVGATVQFNPDASMGQDAGAMGYGITDETGRYEAMYRGEKEGIPPGTYKITLMHYAMPNGDPPPKDMSPTDAGAIATLPPVYSDLTETPLTVVITGEGGTQDFKLQGKKATKK